MILKRTTMLPATLVVAGLGLALWAGQPSARGDGVSGRTQVANGCSCHSSTPNAAVNVVISGPHAVLPGSTNTFTIAVSGGIAGTTGGFDLRASGGTLIPGVGSHLLDNDLVHADETRRSWTFEWTAPPTAGLVELFAVGMASSGSGSSGDGWNFAGGALNTAFAIDVNPLVDVPETALASLWLGPATPNPTARATSVRFTLPAAAPVELDVVNVSGRRVATLLAGELPAGSHVAHWDGRTADGSSATMGLYFLRLRSGSLERTARVILVR